MVTISLKRQNASKHYDGEGGGVQRSGQSLSNKVLSLLSPGGGGSGGDADGDGGEGDGVQPSGQSLSKKMLSMLSLGGKPKQGGSASRSNSRGAAGEGAAAAPSDSPPTSPDPIAE